MATRAHNTLRGALIRKFTVAAASTATANKVAKFGAADDEALDAAAGERGFGVFLDSGAAGEEVRVAVLTGGVIIPVLVGTGGATRGLFGVVVSDGLTDVTLGGGTVAKNVAVMFLQSGVVGDIVGAIPAGFTGVAA